MAARARATSDGNHREADALPPWGRGSAWSNPRDLWRLGNYRVPNPIVSEGDRERFRNADLARMSARELRGEASALRSAMRHYERGGVPVLLIPCPPPGRVAGCTEFSDWARGRMARIGGILHGRAA